jgi:hypothetical protein
MTTYKIKNGQLGKTNSMTWTKKQRKNGVKIKKE